MDCKLEGTALSKHTRTTGTDKPTRIRTGVKPLLIGALCSLGMSALAIAAPNTPDAPMNPGAALTFSAVPTDMEIRLSGLFAEPLVPVSATTAQENEDLATVLRSYRDSRLSTSAADEGVNGLVTFIATHPQSAWNPALQLNVGLIDRQTGHFSRALDVWQQGWEESKGLSGQVGVLMANALAAQLSQLEAYLGRKELLEPLISSLEGRSIGGTARQVIGNSQMGLYDMTHYPEQSFRCGPLALMRILNYRGAEPSALAQRVLNFESPSTDHGLSLSAVQNMAERAGMHYQMAYRTAGAAVLIPAVANWKVGHYAAIVDRNPEGRYVIEDSTFGQDILMSASTLDEESSGYFLVPDGALPEGWRSVSTGEGNSVWGRGNTGKKIDDAATGAGADTQASTAAGSGTTDPGESTDGTAIAQTSATNPAATCPSCGMTTSAVELSVVGLQLNDTPVGYKPPVGSAVQMSLTYSHRDTQQPNGGMFSYTSFGPRWTFNWLSYVTLTNTVTANGGTLVTWYMRGGGSEPFNFLPSNPTTASTGGPYSHTILTKTSNGYTLTFPDGSYEQFDQATGTVLPIKYLMTAVSDPRGNIVTIAYDPGMRISTITDAIGQVTTFSYGLASATNVGPNAYFLVTQITDPFNRSAYFNYYTTATTTNQNIVGNLQSITDVLNITSSYLYGETTLPGNGTHGSGIDTGFINTLTTPYGTTSFVYGDYTTNASLGSTRFLRTTDPMTRTSYVEFNQAIVPGDVPLGGSTVSTALVPQGMNTCNQYMNTRNTFVFDANQYANALVDCNS